jgi:transcription initiation factor TFIIF subunit beta
LFAEKEFWSTKELRQRTEQPVEYIKQALLEHGVAILHKSGPHNNMWELNASYSRSGAAEAIRARTSAEGVASSSKMEEDLGDDDGDDDDDDDDSDEEMEEIA